jgi:hypothetical protein
MDFLQIAAVVCHPNDDLLDEYVLGRLAGTDGEQQLEDHLLVCHTCQDGLDAMSVLIQALRTGLVSTRKI